MALASSLMGENPGLLDLNALGKSPDRDKHPIKGRKRKPRRSGYSRKIKQKFKTLLLSAAALVTTYAGNKGLDCALEIYQDWTRPQEPATEKQIVPQKQVEHHIIYIPVGPNNTMIPLIYQQIFTCNHLFKTQGQYIFTHDKPATPTAPSVCHQKEE